MTRSGSNRNPSVPISASHVLADLYALTRGVPQEFLGLGQLWSWFDNRADRATGTRRSTNITSVSWGTIAFSIDRLPLK